MTRPHHCPHCHGLVLLDQPRGTFRFRCPHRQCKKLLKFDHGAVVPIEAQPA